MLLCECVLMDCINDMKISQCSAADKNTLFRASARQCMPVNCCASTNSPELKAFAFPIVISVRPHQVTYFVTIFHILSRNNLHAFVQECASSCNYFTRSFYLFDDFYKSLFLLSPSYQSRRHGETLWWFYPQRKHQPPKLKYESL